MRALELALIVILVLVLYLIGADVAGVVSGLLD